MFHAFHYVLRQNGYPFYADDGMGLGYDDDSLLADLFVLQLQLLEEGVFASPAVRDEISSVEEDLLVTGDSAHPVIISSHKVGFVGAFLNSKYGRELIGTT